MIDLDAIRASRAACADLPWSCACVSGEQLDALLEEVEYLRGERAAVVAWLREVAPNAPTRRGADELAWCAERIERGEHRREEGGP